MIQDFNIQAKKLIIKRNSQYLGEILDNRAKI